MTAQGAFEQDEAWIWSSEKFKVRALGRSGMEYVSGSLTLRLNTVALMPGEFVLDARELPDGVRDRVVDDVLRAWRWLGFEIHIPEPFDWDCVAMRPPQERQANVSVTARSTATI